MSEKKRKYYAWNEPSMNMAMEAVRKKVVGLNAAARMYGVPKATLKRRLDGSNQKAKEAVQIVGSEGDIPPELEKELCEHILDMERSLYGVTPLDIRRLAFDLAEKNNIKHRFNKEKRMAGKKWYYSFMKRYPQLSLRQPRATSMSRATGFNKPVVKDFYDKLEEVLDKHNIHDAQRIFNMDETGLSTVQRKPRKVLAQKGKRQVGAITSGERGTTTTAVCCANAAGFFVPPLIIFKRKRAKDELRDGAPPGTIFAFNPDSGYINKEIFYVWLQHFVETVKPTPEKKVLLLLDGHASHTKNLAAITFAKTHGVVILSFPAHTTHKLQPLDVSFFKPLSLYYIDETEKWLRQHPGRTVTTFQVSMLFGKAYARAASVGTAANGFAKTGIYPLNKDVFQDYEFIVPEEENIPNPSIQDDIDPLAVNSPMGRKPREECVESRLDDSRSVENKRELTCDSVKHETFHEGNMGQTGMMPWLGVIRAQIRLGDKLQIAVTGAILIKPKFAIAAADDMAKLRRKAPSKAMFISRDRGPWTCKLGEVNLHPEYEFSTLTTIALVELDTESLASSAPMLPVCPPTYMYNTSNQLYALGFTDENKLLEKVAYKMQYVDRALCDEFYERSGHVLRSMYTPKRYECAFAVNNMGNCEWENGMALASNMSGTWVLVGFGVQGPGCSAPARFIDVFTYLHWIERTMGNEDFDVDYPFRVKVRRSEVSVDSLEHILHDNIDRNNYFKMGNIPFNMTFRDFLNTYKNANITTH